MGREYNYFVYITTNFNNTTLYIGVSNSLYRRIIEHKEGIVEGFTKNYKCHKLIYYEYFTDIGYAIAREKQLKKWSRKKKEALIKKMNPEWKDLFDDLIK